MSQPIEPGDTRPVVSFRVDVTLVNEFESSEVIRVWLAGKVSDLNTPTRVSHL